MTTKPLQVKDYKSNLGFEIDSQFFKQEISTTTSYYFQVLQNQTMEYHKLQLLKKDKLNGKDDVALNLSPDGNQFNISINGTTLTATKTTLNATIGDSP